MKLQFHRNFKKHFKILPKHLRDKTKTVIDRFSNNPFEASLMNHPLHGHLEGKRAISVSYGYRITFKEYDDYQRVLLIDVGTHEQLY